MKLFSITLIFCTVLSSKSVLYEGQASLISPFVNENGYSPRYSFAHDWVIYAYDPKEPCLQLGYLNGPTRGSMYGKKPLPQNFRCDIVLKISSPNPKAFVSLLINESNLPIDFSSNLDFNGANITLFTESEPLIGLTTGSKSKFLTTSKNYGITRRLKSKFYNKSFLLRIDYFNRSLIAKIGVGLDTQKLSQIAEIKDIDFETPYLHIGHNNPTSDNSIVQILSIKGFSLSEKLLAIEDKKRESNWLIIFIFIAGICAIAYYLFSGKTSKVRDA